MFRCGADTDAGKAALDYYETRLAAWRRHVRLPLLISLCTACGLAIPVWLYMPRGEFLAGLLIGGTYGMAYWIWDEPPDFIAKWKRGADGERMTGGVLRRLEKAGWRSVHGRQAKYGDLDHVAVGPAGIYLLNSKNLNGRITLTDKGLTARYGEAPCDAFTNRRLSAAMRHSARELKNQVRAATRLTYRVRPIVVIWGEFDQAHATHEGVEYIAGERLENWLREQPHRLSPRDAELIQLGLEAEIILPKAEPLVPATISD